jgi:hypothetical protein
VAAEVGEAWIAVVRTAARAEGTTWDRLVEEALLSLVPPDQWDRLNRLSNAIAQAKAKSRARSADREPLTSAPDRPGSRFSAA